jgi:AraC family transcriptional regulator
MSASEYRNSKIQNSNSSQTKRNPSQVFGKAIQYFCDTDNVIKWRAEMNLLKSVEIKEFEIIDIVYIRNIGPYDGDQENFGKLRDKLFAWGAANGLVLGQNTKFIVMYHDDPQSALSDNLRMSLCLSAPADIAVSGEICKSVIEKGKYAVAKFELRGEEFEAAWNWLYSEWLPQSAYRPDDKPYFELFSGAPKGGIYQIEFCIPVKPE